MNGKISPHRRVVFLGIFITIVFAMLIIRLAYIQIYLGESYGEKAFGQRIVPLSVRSSRGEILDRNGIAFTRRNQRLSLIIFPDYLEQRESLLDSISAMVGVESKSLLKHKLSHTPYIKYKIITRNPQMEEKIEKGYYCGLGIQRDYERYDDSSIARHLIGYLKNSDQSPQGGIEKEYDSYLRSDGEKIVYALADARNRILPGIYYKYQNKKKPPYNVQLTIDYYIQEILEKAMDVHAMKAGGVVVDVETSEILAMASRPNFDQLNIEKSIKSKDSLWSVPLTAFAPGSLFKILVAAAGIEEGICRGDTPYKCQGGITVDGVRYSCSQNAGGLGTIDMGQAFAHSCNDAFINLARDVGGETLITMAEKFGLGESLNIGLDNEEGNLPSEDDYAGAGIGNLALGQGKVELTPIQMAQIMSIIANEGKKTELSLVKDIVDGGGKSIKNRGKVQEPSQVIHPSTAKELRTWMEGVTEYGTGIKANSGEFGYSIGKTGTPQIHGDEDAKYYGWFAGIFPKYKPRYAMVILVREESQGGDKAAEIFRETARGIDNYNKSLN